MSTVEGAQPGVAHGAATSGGISGRACEGTKTPSSARVTSASSGERLWEGEGTRDEEQGSIVGAGAAGASRRAGDRVSIPAPCVACSGLLDREVGRPLRTRLQCSPY